MTQHIIVNPIAGPVDRPVLHRLAVSARGRSAGRAIVLFSNNKPNVDVLYRRLRDDLVRRDIATHVYDVTKLTSAFAAPDADIQEASKRAHLALNGVGD